MSYTDNNELTAYSFTLTSDRRHLNGIRPVGEHVMDVDRFQRRVERNFTTRRRLAVVHVDLQNINMHVGLILTADCM